MPLRKQAEALEHMCFVKVAQTIHSLAVQLEEDPECHKMSTEKLSAMVSALPAVINENMIVKVIETIHKTFSRTRRTVGMKTCLEVLLQKHVQRLELNGLFFKMRLQGTINSTIRNIVCAQVTTMRNLMTLNMVSKCSDEILCVVSEKCPEVSDVNVSISDLVTDAGIKALANGCPKLENLGIYKCWNITTEGIAYVLKHSRNLKKLKCDQLGAVLINEFSTSKSTFKLIHFEQTQTLFEPTAEDIRWVGNACPNLESVSLFVDDKNLSLVPLLGQIRVLEVETGVMPGDGFIEAIKYLGNSLQTLQLSCNKVQQEVIVVLGECCPSLTTLHLSTAALEGDKLLANPGQLFSGLTVLHLQVWKESVLSNKWVDFFLLWCRKLESVLLKAEVGFLTDEYLSALLAVNPLTEAKYIVIASDEFVPLTLESVHRLMSSCPALENLGLSSWNITEEEFFQIRDDIKTNNYNLNIS
ncbi:F-box/LRR-repeat protein 4-like [Portunus trituberculatus]|uniref:F-box/LRR-repeat protein 4-like n=1 Tax=Portunus trituberculatus TaxID=210409 RepID=UPI001E1CB759|nr:F-box/LRR-repeat protein 4-like [Portunus trituberculatus]XP_045114168.1 F-box/LRR-repeat protein 4-like [Portunus trituberculatus]XP_045114169.1 F-box/LRR-repeat protein 4-like [Portunus trituberculatus]XP_045114171.1 F-box/LRR-repeat protein 4-like [Portunus trituberculatus]XP_045114172.1 F-box/LRR-repeat protein 4-like [Portunus trituberculatus]